jgi:hypothetical protein
MNAPSSHEEQFFAHALTLPPLSVALSWQRRAVQTSINSRTSSRCSPRMKVRKASWSPPLRGPGFSPHLSAIGLAREPTGSGRGSPRGQAGVRP